MLTRKDGKLDMTRVSALVDQIAALRKSGIEVILVSSGAMASGRGELKVDHDLDSVEQRQLFSALGQAKLIGLYYDLFREYGMHVGQVLTMKENFEPGEQYENQKACMTVMLENDVIPIVNENDTVSVTELMFTDNDELSWTHRPHDAGRYTHPVEQYRRYLYGQSRRTDLELITRVAPVPTSLNTYSLRRAPSDVVACIRNTPPPVASSKLVSVSL